MTFHYLLSIIVFLLLYSYAYRLSLHLLTLTLKSFAPKKDKTHTRYFFKFSIDVLKVFFSFGHDNRVWKYGIVTTPTGTSSVHIHLAMKCAFPGTNCVTCLCKQCQHMLYISQHLAICSSCCDDLIVAPLKWICPYLADLSTVVIMQVHSTPLCLSCATSAIIFKWTGKRLWFSF